MPDDFPEKGWFGLKGWMAQFWNFTAMAIITGMVLWYVHKNDELTAAELSYLRTELANATAKADAERATFWTKNAQQHQAHMDALKALTEAIQKARP